MKKGGKINEKNGEIILFPANQINPRIMWVS